MSNLEKSFYRGELIDGFENLSKVHRSLHGIYDFIATLVEISVDTSSRSLININIGGLKTEVPMNDMVSAFTKFSPTTVTIQATGKSPQIRSVHLRPVKLSCPFLLPS